MELEAQNDDTNRSKKLKNDRIYKISFLDARYKWGLSSDAANTISCPFTAVIFSSMYNFWPIFHVFFLEKSLKNRSKIWMLTENRYSHHLEVPFYQAKLDGPEKNNSRLFYKVIYFGTLLKSVKWSILQL